MEDSDVSGNINYGVSVTPGCAVTRCTANNTSSGDGFSDFNNATGCSFIHCSASNNAGIGISAGKEALVADCLVTSNQSDGIAIDSQSRVSRNQLDHNAAGTAGAGIHVYGSEKRIVIQAMIIPRGITYHKVSRVCRVDQDAARVVAKVVVIVIATGNRVGSIVVPPLSGDISGDSDPDAAGAGTTDPWANISY